MPPGTDSRPVYVLFLRHCRSCSQHLKAERSPSALLRALRLQPSCTSGGARHAEQAAEGVARRARERGLPKLRVSSSLLPRAMETAARLARPLGLREVRALCFVGERAHWWEQRSACTAGSENLTSWPLARCFAASISEDTGVAVRVDPVAGLSDGCECREAPTRTVSARCLDATGATAKTTLRCTVCGTSMGVPPRPGDMDCFRENLGELLRAPVRGSLHVVVSHGAFLRESFPELGIRALANLDGVLAEYGENGQLLRARRYFSGLPAAPADEARGDPCEDRDLRRNSGCRRRDGPPAGRDLSLRGS